MKPTVELVQVLQIQKLLGSSSGDLIQTVYQEIYNQTHADHYLDLEPYLELTQALLDPDHYKTLGLVWIYDLYQEAENRRLGPPVGSIKTRVDEMLSFRGRYD